MPSLYQHNHSEHLLHVLFEEQQKSLHISETAISSIANSLNLPRSQVESVVEFYSFFHRQPRGRFDILFSNCTCCGDLSLMKRLCDRLNVEADKTRADGLVSIGQTSCIGMCDHDASMLINGVTITSLSTKIIDRMAELIESETSLSLWPGSWFQVGNNIRKEGLLLSEFFEPGSALKAMAERSHDDIIEEITASGLKGRGGAGFATGMKWRFCRDAAADTRYVICNADEGEPGTFKDRILLNSHADTLFEGMTICARSIGATRGYLYLRGEYRYMLENLESTLQQRRESGLLGNNILDQGFDFDIAIVVGAGAYICGEESALIESIEEKAGIPRIRPPFPVTQGLWGQPTVVNNVETLVAAAGIVLHGHHWFETAGTWQSKGSKLISVSGDCGRPGIYEYVFGITVQEILDDAGAENVQAVQIGGPAGRLIAADHFSHRIAFEDLATGGSFMIFDESRDLLEIIHNFSSFFAHESCGFCTPCRVGTTLLKNGMDKVCSGHATAHDLDELSRTAALVSRRSHCGLGMTAPNAIRDGLKYFPDCFEKRLLHKEMEPEFNLDASLEEARQLTRRDDAEAHL
ncbi:bidirectional [NiFe] hydrogenase diaphorase subunit [Mariprofundus micogutta]|uniref:Bidirectional [NiFe] hydrogenase diaphorase subunit n=1 Tax=Mariprofundus micogutta TaxID=1921010 RepID=A0A1L8CPV2_9PROT|nr:NADH-ubiquinone oxidoreductase-F iron-sulfur binding region domain-containing protein [Mariprofundus micogutta]GAV20952.1 bidirectional [NiFe] hydrogenase diaphorase subunit [Mariprofundus micogutta]